MIARDEAFPVEKPPPSRSLSKRQSVGRFWGRGRFSERSASPPDPLSRRAAGVRRSCFCIGGSACKAGAASCCFVVVTAADRAAATMRREGGILSHALPRMTAPSAEGVKGNFASAEARRWTEPVWQLSDRPRHPFGPPANRPLSGQTSAGRGGSVSRRDLNSVYRRHAQLSGGTNSEESYPAKRQPLFGREREEGKDSHSRQWRLSMAVFLNRNKRPQAAPIEVAELLSEKPPPSQPPRPFHLFGRGPGGGASRREAASPGVLPRPHSISSNSNRFCSHVSQRGSHWAAAGFSFWRVPADAGLARAKPC